MIQTKFFNVHDVLLIVLVTAIIHVLLTPLYAAINGGGQSSSDVQPS